MADRQYYDSGPSAYDDAGVGGSASKKRRLDDGVGSVGGGDDDDQKPGVGKDKQGGASEFVKKLYRMLEEDKFNDIVSWGYTGDSFVVKDMNSFTRDILPLHFKHSNFASFVRQLNKYDFHKVKNPEDGGNPYGEHTWEFKHPNFRADMKDALEHIKRKAPAGRKTTPVPSGNRPRPGPASLSIDPNLQGGGGGPHHPGDLSALQAQIDNLRHQQQGMSQHMANIANDYQLVMGEMMNFQRNMVAQDQLMQNLIQYLVNLEADQKAAQTASPTTDSGPFVPSTQAQKLISSYTEVARASYDQMADLSRRASLSGGSMPQIPPPPPGFGRFDMPNVVLAGGPPPPRRDDRSNGPHPPGSAGGYDPQQPQQSPQQPQQAGPYRRDGPPSSSHGQRDAQQQQQQQAAVAAQQHREQQHREQQQHQMMFQHPNAPPHAAGDSTARPGSYVPGWAVPPRVLLVEDDSVCRKLSSKFLQVFGCQIDIAEDGVSAVNKMNEQKYDLVLMDIVMPNLDGVSATSLIRQFDPMTPIISMTSNSGPNDIMTYFSHGMNDILPKPFTKEGLLGMLEKHLIHLKVMQQLSEIPRALGFTDNQIQDALAVSATDQGSVMNPFSGMGISDQDYLDLLQNIALEKEGKRGLEVVLGDGKRARFLLEDEA